MQRVKLCLQGYNDTYPECLGYDSCLWVCSVEGHEAAVVTVCRDQLALEHHVAQHPVLVDGLPQQGAVVRRRLLTLEPRMLYNSHTLK